MLHWGLHVATRARGMSRYTLRQNCASFCARKQWLDQPLTSQEDHAQGWILMRPW